MPFFDSITFEAYLGGVWTDITADVRLNPAPRASGLGIMGNTIADRVGDIGVLTFSLNNSTSNSGGVDGYYTPQGANTRSGWQAGVPVRLSFTYDGYTRYKFYGIIDFDGIEVIAGRYGERSVRVRASNWMKYASEQKVSLLQRKTNYRMDNAVQDILDRSSRKPDAVVWRGQGLVTFPTVFDTLNEDTKAIAEFQKLAMSEFGSIYVAPGPNSGETLYVEYKNWFKLEGIPDSDDIAGTLLPVINADITDDFLLEDGTSFLLLENGDNLLLENSQRATFTDSEIRDLKPMWGKTLRNKIKIKMYPRTVDSSVVTLCTLEDPIFIEAGETLSDIRNNYKDPNNQAVSVSGFDFVAPAATTDYLMFANADGTGTDYTANLTITAEYGAGEVVYTLINGAASDAYITKLNARGKGVYIYDTIDKVYLELSGTVATFGEIPLDLNCFYLAGITDLFQETPKTGAGVYGDILLGTNLNELTIEKLVINANRSSKAMMAFMFLDPGTYIEISETMSATVSGGTSRARYQNAWRIVGYDFEILNGKFVNWMPALKHQGRF